MVDSYVAACNELATAVAEGVYGDHDFIALPRPPSDSERALNGTANHVWPDLYFLRAADGTEAVYVNSRPLSPGTLLPFGGNFVTHWEYLTQKAVDSTAVSTWILVEDADQDGRPMWFSPESKEPLLSPHLFVGAARKNRAKDLNVKIVWSVFGAEEFSTSARLFYCTLRRLNKATRLWGPSVIEFFADHMWGPAAKLAAQAIKARFVGGDKCPHSIEDLRELCLGKPGREERIYGAYQKTDCVNRSVFALPDSCILPVAVGGVSASPQPAIEEDGDTAALGEDPAVTHRLPEEYHGVLVQRHRGRKI